MKTLLINTPSLSLKPVTRDMAGGLGFNGGENVILPPLDLLYFASTLRRSGHTVKIIDADAYRLSQDKVIEEARRFAPDTIILEISLPTISNDISFAKNVKDALGADVIIKTGINYPPLLENILKQSRSDLCIFGECDAIIDKIIERKTREGTAYIEDGRLIKEDENLLKNLDELPFPARDLIDVNKYVYFLLGEPVTTMQTSRGCPFPCSYYCPYPLVQGSEWRTRSPKNIVEEIEDITEKYKINKIFFRDAVFTLSKERTERVCALILRRGIDISWWCETRINCLDNDLVEIMKQAGCRGINIGVETGDPEVLRTYAKRGATLEKLMEIVKICKKIGIKMHFLLMLGLPQETRKSLYQTYKLVRMLKPHSIGVTVITPYPGTPLYEEAKSKGWIRTHDWSCFGGSDPVMSTDNLSPYELLQARQMILKGYSFSKSRSPINRIKAHLVDEEFKRWANIA